MVAPADHEARVYLRAMSEPVANVEQAGYWESRASSWIDAEAWTVEVGGAFGRAALDALGPTAGWTVVDVGCGTGPTTVELARQVAPGGSVLGVDIAPSMIEAARSRAEREGVGGVEFLVADAQAHDLGEGRFDAVFSQFGVMFFEDPPAAFANLRRSLRAGGRLGFACWQDLFANDWMFVPGAAAIGASGAAPSLPRPGQPGPFSLSDPAQVERLLATVGFTEVQVVPSTDTAEIPAEQLDAVVQASCAVGAAREALEATPDPEVRASIHRAVHDALAERVVDGRLRLAAAALLVTATA